MSSSALLRLRPSDLAQGRPYVERHEEDIPWLDRAARALWHDILWPAFRPLRFEALRRRAFIARVELHARGLDAIDDPALRQLATAAGRRLRDRGFASDPVAQAFALVREASGRVLGKRHYDTQLSVGALLLQDTLVEMATGEGKTFAATLAAVTAALAGLPVHVITVNDYLAARDAQEMEPLYRFFGLRVDAVVHGMTREQRRAVYAGDVVYASNKELAFDYLRDRAALGDRASTLHLAVASLRSGAAQAAAACVMRGLVFAIVDEADSVFVDEARTPLILSAMVDAGSDRGACERALQLARGLTPREHFVVEPALRRVRLTSRGRVALVTLPDVVAASTDAPDDVTREAEQSVQRALSALHLYQRDQHYVVVDGKVQIVDEATGRAMPDRAWEHGLHQMIEVKEGLDLTGLRQTLARITYQRLFRRYLRLAGMSGTATEVAAEIGRTYGLAVVRVPLHRPSLRRMLVSLCLPDAAAKWQAVADSVACEALEKGRPVLIGTRTVRASEELSAVLSARGITHVVLNARQDNAEADIIAGAGAAGRVTVATNMAGRGTDILLGPGVAQRGGLHVILTEFHESARIDRQLVGRSGRQGDPGSGQAIVALDDEIFDTHAPGLRAMMGRTDHNVGPIKLALLRRMAQRSAERIHREARDGSLAQDRRFSQMLAFSGRGE